MKRLRLWGYRWRHREPYTVLVIVAVACVAAAVWAAAAGRSTPVVIGLCVIASVWAAGAVALAEIDR